MATIPPWSHDALLETVGDRERLHGILVTARDLLRRSASALAEATGDPRSHIACVAETIAVLDMAPVATRSAGLDAAAAEARARTYIQAIDAWLTAGPARVDARSGDA